jgi:hypothetical protein
MGTLTIALLTLVVISNTFMAMMLYEIMPITFKPLKWFLYIPPLAWLPVIAMTIVNAIDSIKNDFK